MQLVSIKHLSHQQNLSMMKSQEIYQLNTESISQMKDPQRQNQIHGNSEYTAGE